MKNKVIISFLVLIVLFLTSCFTVPSANKSGPRTLVLDGIYVSEDETDSGFTAWECEDYFDGGSTVLEVGYFDKNNIRYAFVLQNGGYTGSIAHLTEDGLGYSWDWGYLEDSYRYTLEIGPEEKAYYYDFSIAEKGEKIKHRYFLRAEKR